MILPTTVTRGSSFTAQTAPVPASASFRMDRNLYNVNGSPPMPTRTWRYRTGPGELNRTASATSSISGSETTRHTAPSNVCASACNSMVCRRGP